MLEGLVAWVINNYLGKYVENLNTHQLSIALLHGAVELENLPLKKDALRQVGLPIQVRAGLIGKVKLKIPVTQLTSAPWEIFMERLYLIAGPARLSEMDEEVEEQAFQDYKLSQLDAIEASWRSQTEASQDSSYYASYSSWVGMSMNFAANIIENLQLKIKDVHIRYEDNITVDSKVFAAGVQIESLTAQSCDDSWNPTFVSCSTKESFKLMEMHGFSVYCNEITEEEMWGDLPLQDLLTAMCEAPSVSKSYILSPVAGEAHVKRNRSDRPLRSRTNPRVVCDLILDHVPLSLSDMQYQLMVGCKKGLVNMSRRYGHLRSRPKCRVASDPRAWWRYALLRVAKPPRATWPAVLGRARENVAYVQVYSKTLSSQTDPLSVEDKALKDKVEWERGYEELKELREIAMRRTRPPPDSRLKAAAASGKVGLLASWFPGWWQSSLHLQQELQEGAEQTSELQLTQPTDPDTAALEEQILDALADTVENNTILKRDTVFGQFNFTLKKGSFDLTSGKETSIELQFENVQLGYESRPRNGSHSVQVALGALYLKDHLTRDSAFPVLVSPQRSECGPSGRCTKGLPPGLARLVESQTNQEEAKDQPLFHFLYEYKPFNSSAERRLEIQSKSLDIVYNPVTTKWILDFWTGPYQAMDSGLRQAARQGYHAMKKKTKQQLLSNWESIVHGHGTNRKSWDIELSISAPQIFFVEHFNDKNAVLCVVDFGKLHFTNRTPGTVPPSQPEPEVEEEEDDEAFQTPCSTPPGSEISSFTSSRNASVDATNINELQFHDKLYDKYTIDFCDLQILVGCVRDNWKFAHLRGTSSLHILDKFNISLLMERRVVHTIDPQYPSLTLMGNLPKLVAHVNEDKVKAVKTLLDVVSGKGLISPLRSQDNTPAEEAQPYFEDEGDFSEIEIDTSAKLLMLQFSIDQMALEVQSRGRSVAELQVSGVKASYQKRPYDTSLSLTVHGLLLVDALQTFGPDFELLIASHKHVGMDTVSGSLQDSEPTSPTSPASPAPEPDTGALKLPTSPVAISKALSNITSQRGKSPVDRLPSPPHLRAPSLAAYSDTEALISVELTLVDADCPTNDEKEYLQIANIQFNNLDIIANQETIVELVGFVHRVFPKQKCSSHFVSSPTEGDTVDSRKRRDSGGGGEGSERGGGGGGDSTGSSTPTTRTQLTFDFHRLNVLLLRALLREGGLLVGRKIATATMTEAKIHANVGSSLEVEGSLGGLQVLDLTPEGQSHQRILSLGDDPLTEKTRGVGVGAAVSPGGLSLEQLAAQMYNMSGTQPSAPNRCSYNNQAFSFSVKRSSLGHETDVAEIQIRMASVWYVHSPHIIYELKSCAAEFKQYLSNFLMSIKSAATEMAIGIVHARAESLAQSLSMGSRLYASLGDVSQTPRKRRSLSYYSSSDHLESSTRGSVTPHSPAAAESNWNTLINNDGLDSKILSSCASMAYEELSKYQLPRSCGSGDMEISLWDVVLASPVVVVARSATSREVAVAHLGSISLTNSEPVSPVSSPWGSSPYNTHKYDVCVTSMNLYTLNISKRIQSLTNLSDCYLMRAEELYCSGRDGIPVLHDTSIQLSVTRELGHVRMRQADDLLLEYGADFFQVDQQENLQVHGSIVNTLKLSLNRGQYEQLLETVDRLLTPIQEASEEKDLRTGLSNIEEEPEIITGVSTLRLDPALRARMVAHGPRIPSQLASPPSSISLTVGFECPLLSVELIADLGSGQQKLVDLSFKELLVHFEKLNSAETTAQISLNSLLMEDLQKPADSKHRCIVVSSHPPPPPSGSSSDPSSFPYFISKSCPSLSSPQSSVLHPWHYSLPDHLETGEVLGAVSSRHRHVIAAENSMENRMKSGGQPKVPYTPPPSPRGKMSPNVFREDNLVHVNVIMKPSKSNKFAQSRQITVDFNSLDVIVNVESWVVVLDFFGISDIDQKSTEKAQPSETIHTPSSVKSFDDAEAGLDSELEITVKSLSVVLNRAEYEVAKAVMSGLRARLVSPLTGTTELSQTEASVSSFVLYDLAPYHSTLYRERFITAGLRLQLVKYNSPDVLKFRPFDMKMSLDFSQLVYVHTQRYVSEILAFFNLFPHLRREVGVFRGNLPEDDINAISTRLLMEVRAPSPIIILPMSSQSPSCLVAHVGNLTVSNSLKYSASQGLISQSTDSSREVLLDVMNILLEGMDLTTGERATELASETDIPVGSYCVRRLRGGSLLREKCHLKLQVERNLNTYIHIVPDMTIHGTLSTLAAQLTLSDYQLISGLLSFNIGECLDDLQLPELTPSLEKEADCDEVWTTTSMKFELVDVSVSLVPNGISDLACINFIKSSLTVDNFSNRTQDIDLVSQEILITDIRFRDQPANKRSNVFTNILQPMQSFSESDTVQAQIHHRRNVDSSKFTILLNNMRLMAVVDWWEAVRDFIMTKPDNIHAVSVPRSASCNSHENLRPQEYPEIPYELKLNITDSEIVVVEDSSQWDTNAVILKSTTVISYKPNEVMKPVSCNLNHCEMFSCILGMEEDTALSIIDPVTVNMEITMRQDLDGQFHKVLRVHMAQLSLRLSYHDIRMFNQMLLSLPRQTQYAKSQVAAQQPANFRYQLEKLKALGFRLEDCSTAISLCNGQLDDAALWLTQNAVPLSSSQPSPSGGGEASHRSPHPAESLISFNKIEIETDNVCLCIIDDCQDADVPLLELSLTKLELRQDVEKMSGVTTSILSLHYYNRLLSGWEPFIEPWNCNLCWDYCLSQKLTKSRLEVTLASSDTLNMNITSTLVELYNSVKEIWTQDYYRQTESLTRLERGDLKHTLTPPGYRRRSPFVPFAIRNDTGSRLYFSTATQSEESLLSRNYYKTAEDMVHWIVVDPNGTVPFSFNERGKGRHRDTHKLRSHQIRVRVEGWLSTSPVTVDRVGVYFREAFPDLQVSSQDMPMARIVLEVTLEGSAKKLITVRSALQIHNKLDQMVEVKLNNAHFHRSIPLHLTVCPGDVLSVPLSHAMALLHARPLDPQQNYSFSTKPIPWQHVSSPEGQLFETRQCNTNSNQPYRFCVSIKRENYPVEKSPPLAPPLAQAWTQPAHLLTLCPPLTVLNLLPYELYYSVRGLAGSRSSQRIVKPGNKHSSSEVNLENCLELVFNLENFPSGGLLTIPEFTNGFSTRIRLQDQSGRRLHLQAQILSHPGAAIKVVISAPYWFVNKTALAIVFKQEGVSVETAGQYEEHEVARMVAPLLFSFADTDGSPTVIARIGNGVHPEGHPQWCRHFTLTPGVQVRRLNVSLRDNRPDLVYMIGVEIRQGKGRYRPTKIVTLSAHYQIHNKSSYKLQFAQKCFASTVSDPGAQATYLTAVPSCYLPFHWPRLDKDQLLCLRILDVPNCFWSGGFKIDSNTSFHLNIRDPSGSMNFLRIEIVLQGATYFIVLTDSDTMPPPIRIDNFSKVPITVHQLGLSNYSTTVKAGSSMAYAWDEPTRDQVITCTAPGGVSADYNLNRLGDGPGLTYENFIYIAFTATFKKSKSGRVDLLDVENQQLVLDVPDPTSGKVVLSQKQPGARSQLWRMTASGHLQHEGSSPPRAPSDKVMVLDISGPAPQPSQYVGLVVRRPDKRRVSTQSWKFTEEGRLCCAHSSMCVQAKDGFFGLHRGSEVVLGPPQQVTYQTTESGVPLEQAVSRQRLRPGSGFLAVCVTTDGPTRLLRISDIKEKRTFSFDEEGSWLSSSDSRSIRKDKNEARELQITLNIPVVGVSLVSRSPPEELLYAHLSSLRVYTFLQASSHMLELSIQDIQVDNQVFEAQCPVALYVPVTRSADPEDFARPAISISAEKTPNKYSYNADIFKHLIFRVKNMSLILDERLLLKLFKFVGWNKQERNENADESDFETQRILAEAGSVHAKRYYFGSLKILFTQVRLSFITCSKLDPELQAIKRKLGFTFIKFEDANIDLQAFSRQHAFENNQILFNSIINHYKDELKWQAGFILGSVDFLGNPVGFVNDLTEGVTGFLTDGNVGVLVKNVAHGVSNSAAKVAGTLGDGIGMVILDDRHEEMRQRIRNVPSGSSSEHFVAGLKGFGFGILGGVTSLVKQTYDGAANDGFQGLITGLGKGLVGTVTKPVVGVLDFASEAATALRDSSRSSSKQIPPKKRRPRCVVSPAGFLPPYNMKQSQGQQYLYTLNNNNFTELFMAYEVLRSGSDDLRIVISSESVRVFSCTNSSGISMVFEIQLGELDESKPLTMSGISFDQPLLHYIEFKMRDVVSTSNLTQEGKRPKVRCDSEPIALWVSQQVNYAKERYIERQKTLVINPSGQNVFDD